MRKRLFTSVNVYADKIHKIQFEPNKPLKISANLLKKRKPLSLKTAQYCSAAYKAQKEIFFKTIEANGGNVEDFEFSDSESEGDSDIVEMESIKVIKMVHPEVRNVMKEDEDGKKHVDRYVTVFKMCTEQKESGSSTIKDIVYKT